MIVFDPRWRTGHLISDPIAGESTFPFRTGANPKALPRRSIDLRDRAPAIRAQRRQNCCAHAVSAQLVINARAEGIDLAEPSVEYLYVEAQLYASPHQPLRDDGSSLRAMFVGGSDAGLVSERSMPEGEGDLELPPDDLIRDAEDGKILTWEILPDGLSSSEAIYQALEDGLATTICWIVDEAYANVGAGVHRQTGGRPIGAHCQIVVGYDAILDAFIVRNSWGTDFGDLGYALVAAAFVDRFTYEKFLCRHGPRIVR